MEWLAAQVHAALAGVDEFSRWLVGAADGKSSYELTRWVFLRALGVIYLIAFLSLWPQLRGLIGPQGILPAQALLAVLFAPGHLLPRGAARPASALALFLLWWLLFRLTFQSGIVKLTSGDPTWRNLTALDYHFWTQPLPTWTAWYVHLLPGGAKKLMVVGTYLLEIGVPFLIFVPRPVRLAACAGIILM